MVEDGHVRLHGIDGGITTGVNRSHSIHIAPSIPGCYDLPYEVVRPSYQ